MKKIIALLLLFAFVNIFALPVQAVTVKAGKKIPIVGDYVTSKKVKSGDIISGHVQRNIIVDGKVVFAEGAPVTINVASAHKAHRWGVAGDMTLINGTAEDVTGEEREIQFDYDIKGTEKDWVKATAGLCLATIILFPFGFLALIKGGEAELQPTNIINAELIDDFSI